MCTLITFIIIGTIIIVAIQNKKRNTPDKRDMNQVVAMRQQIPNLEFIGQKLSGLDKLWYGEKYTLSHFKYTNGVVTMTSANNKVFSAPLEKISVYFEEVKDMPLCVTAKYNGTDFSFYVVPGVYSDEEYGKILSVMHWAGTTYGEALAGFNKGFNNTAKGIKAATKIINYLNK